MNGYYASINDGVIDLSRLSFSPAQQVKIVFALQADNAELYLDSATMKWSQLQTRGVWRISDTAVRSTMQGSTVSGGITFNYQVAYEGSAFPASTFNGSFSLIAKPGTAVLNATGVSDGVGYLLSKPVSIAAGATWMFTDEDVANTARLSVPSGSGSVNLIKNYAIAMFEQVNQFRATKGSYGIILQTIDAQGYTSNWYSDTLDLTTEHTLSFGSPVLSLLTANTSDSRFTASLQIRNGDFQLTGVYSREDDPTNLIQNGLRITNADNKVVYDSRPQSNEWLNINASLSPKLTTGLYKAEITISYPGLAQPLTVTNTFRVEHAEDYADKGIYVTAENEKGKPLTGGTATLYRTQPPYIDDANEGIKANETYRVGSWRLEDGAIVIPYDNLMKGFDYEVVVSGDTSKGRSGVLYTASVTRDDQRVRFTAADLKHVALHANQAESGDPVLVGLLNEQGDDASYPWSIPFIEQTAEAWIQTSHTVDFFTKLTDGENGYFLNKQIKLQNAETAIDLNGNLVEVALPSGYTGQLDINYSWYKDRFAAKHYFVTKGLDAVAYYDIDKDGYRYSLAKYLGPVTEKRTLALGSTFTNQTPVQQVYSAGYVNQKVYTNYWDSQDNRLTGVAPIEASTIVSGMTSNNITFKLNDGGTLRTIALEPASEGYGYSAIGYNDASLNSVASGGLVDYRLYNSANQPVGDPISAQDVDSIWLKAPLPAGAYTLRLVRQNFPDSFVKLAGEEKILVEGSYYEGALEIPLEMPSNYGFDEQSNGYAVLQESGGGRCLAFFGD
ncbi:hypothetical protein [Cohnella rhizosphaerae]|uniref:Uncharacterized protein n=1 Tax=Cohnella rhizosphaerae TaxID=1457232 RepID=A0A9X4QVJ4_9BACL|nr:hypothetical protein [Cohnella rhizosphaerae]MDG0811557.1 hypothetical protein [Cohnella rhizosphaerae]